MSDWFMTESEDGLGTVFVPRGPWRAEHERVLRAQGASGLRLSASAGWRGDDVAFLEGLSGLRSVEIYSWSVKDVSPLLHLPALEMVGLECDVQRPVNLASLTELRVFKARWAKPLASVLNCAALRHLNVVNWPYEDLGHLIGMRDLRRLQLTSRKLSSLLQIGSLPVLEALDLYACTQLRCLDGVEACSVLRSVQLTSCKKIRDISPLGSLSGLREVYLDDGGEIETLEPLVGCQKLERLSFVGSTRILDGRISILSALPHLATLFFAPRRHYDSEREAVLQSTDG